MSATKTDLCSDAHDYGWTEERAGVSSPSAGSETPTYQRRPIGCSLAGDTEGGGLDIVRPLAGLMMGMALRVRVAAG